MVSYTTSIILCFLIIAHIVCGLPSHTNNFQSVQTAAKLARKVLSDAGRGTMLTVMNESVSSEFSGFPFGTMEYFTDKCTNNGDLLLYMSNLQFTTRNMIHSDFDKVGFAIKALKDYNPVYGNYSSPFQQPRFTLFGEISKVSKSKTDQAKSCFYQTHPDAKPWGKFHDFSFYVLHVKGIYYIGGFGGINYIGWIPLEIYQNVPLEEEAEEHEEPKLRIQEAQQY